MGIDKTGTNNDYYEINGEELINLFSLVAFDQDGQYLWQINNESTIIGNINNVKVDEDSNIYVVGRMISDSGEFSNPDIHDSFAGFVNSGKTINGNFGDQTAFIVKLDSDGELIWGSNPEYYTPLVHALEIDDEHVYMSSSHAKNEWGEFEFEFPTNAGTDPFFAVLDRETGEIQDFVSIEGLYDGSTAHITTIKKDKVGNLILAGTFMNNLFIPYGPELALTMAGPHGDIFVAKYGFESCALSTEDFTPTPTSIKMYPNPANNQVFFESNLALEQVKVFSINGKQVLRANLSQNNNIQVSDLATGIYLVQIQTQNGQVETRKLVVE